MEDREGSLRRGKLEVGRDCCTCCVASKNQGGAWKSRGTAEFDDVASSSVWIPDPEGLADMGAGEVYEDLMFCL
jgi:hypothetical protein